MKEEQYIDVYGLHGTSKEQAKSIEAGGFDPSRDGYYGSGVYFYENTHKGKEYAIRWARRKESVIAVIRANLYCSKQTYIDLTRPDYGLKAKISAFSKITSCNDVKFNTAVKKLFKNFLYAVEQEIGMHCALVKVLVPEGDHHGWDCGYVARDVAVIKSQKMLDLL